MLHHVYYCRLAERVGLEKIYISWVAENWAVIDGLREHCGLSTARMPPQRLHDCRRAWALGSRKENWAVRDELREHCGLLLARKLICEKRKITRLNLPTELSALSRKKNVKLRSWELGRNRRITWRSVCSRDKWKYISVKKSAIIFMRVLCAKSTHRLGDLWEKHKCIRVIT